MKTWLVASIMALCLVWFSSAQDASSLPPTSKQSKTVQRVMKTALVLLLVGIVITVSYQLYQQADHAGKADQSHASQAESLAQRELVALGEQLAQVQAVRMPLFEPLPSAPLSVPCLAAYADERVCERVTHVADALQGRMHDDRRCLGMRVAEFAQRLEQSQASMQERVAKMKTVQDEHQKASIEVLGQCKALLEETLDIYDEGNEYFEHTFKPEYDAANRRRYLKKKEELYLPPVIAFFADLCNELSRDPLGTLRGITSTVHTVREAGEAFIDLGNLGSRASRRQLYYDSSDSSREFDLPSDIDPVLYGRIQTLRASMPSVPLQEPGGSRTSSTFRASAVGGTQGRT